MTKTITHENAIDRKVKRYGVDIAREKVFKGVCLFALTGLY